MLNVVRTVSEGKIVELAKNDRSRRQVPLSERALAALDGFRHDSTRRWLFPPQRASC